MPLDWLNDPSLMAPPRAVRVPLDHGCFVLRSPESLKPYARCIGEWLEHWSERTPDAPAFAERQADGGWQRLTWRGTRERVGRIAQSLLDMKLPPNAPVVVLSDNSLEHLLLALAAMHVGIPVCTVSSAYCRLTQDYSKVHGILNTLVPALVYASDAAVYGPAISSSGLRCPIVFGRGAEQHAGALPFGALLEKKEGPGVRQAYEAITPDMHAKYLLTSGSTGHPKVVINTHRMLCANQQMIAQAWRFLDREKPVLVDWLPWSHTFGANHNLHMVLRNGGMLAIDEGRPAPGLIEKTLANLAEVQPTIWFNVPRGFDVALPLLEADPELARKVFARLRVIFYAGAALPQATWERLQALARKVRGEDVWLTTSWGSTETSPAITSAHWKLDRAGVIGGMLPGLEMKFVPNGEMLTPRRRSTPRATTASAMPASWPTSRIRNAAWSSTAGWPRTSSSPRAPGFRWAHCASRWCLRSRHWRRTWWSRGTTGTRSVSSCFPRRPPRRCLRESWQPASERRCASCAKRAVDRRSAPCARWCWRNRRARTRGRSPTRATSTSGRCCSAGRSRSRGCMRGARA